MKSLVPEAVNTLLLNAADIEIHPELEGDAALVRFIAKQLRSVRHYLLPVSGEIDRARLLRDGQVPVSACQWPAPAFSIEFNVSEKGFLLEGAPQMVSPSFIRMALIQDLRDATLRATWQQLLPGSAELLHRLAEHSLLVLPINRVSDPSLSPGPGNRGWMSGWIGTLIDLRQPAAEVRSQGEMLALSIDYEWLPMGKTGEMTLLEMDGQGVDTVAEIYRETALEILSTLDFGAACARKTANVRRFEQGGPNVWRAGSGPLMPKRLLA